MKTQKELNEIKKEVETVSRKLQELTEEELSHVTGGYWTDCHDCPNYQHVRKCTEVKARGECPKGHV